MWYWLPYWKAEGWEEWGKELWEQPYLIARPKQDDRNTLQIGHVSAHTKCTDLGSGWNHEVDCLTKEPIKNSDIVLSHNIYILSMSVRMILGWLHECLGLTGALDL